MLSGGMDGAVQDCQVDGRAEAVFFGSSSRRPTSSTWILIATSVAQPVGQERAGCGGNRVSQVGRARSADYQEGQRRLSGVISETVLWLTVRRWQLVSAAQLHRLLTVLRCRGHDLEYHRTRYHRRAVAAGDGRSSTSRSLENNRSSGVGLMMAVSRLPFNRRSPSILLHHNPCDLATATGAAESHSY